MADIYLTMSQRVAQIGRHAAARIAEPTVCGRGQYL
jgi:hypothetical protein